MRLVSKINHRKFNSKCSLFIGRWQPFHKGHRVLLETVLKRNKPVVIAIRDTPLDSKNPFTVQQRKKMIYKSLSKYKHLVNIIVIPDIDEFCYGRNVGYDIRLIRHTAENISGTVIRKIIKNNSNLYNKQ